MPRHNEKQDAELWDTGCINDQVRNDFIIPELLNLQAAIRPKTITDVGCGTGYISRKMHQLNPSETQWRLIDLNADRLAYAQHKQPAEQTTCYITGNVFDSSFSVCVSDWVLICNSLLEFELDAERSAAICNLIARNGHLIILLPDTILDVMDRTKGDPVAIARKYATGTIKVEKIDKFTERPYPFVAHRAINVVCVFTQLGLDLVSLKRSELGGGHFLLVFRKQN